LEHLRENLLQQLNRPRPSHVIVLPNAAAGNRTVLADAVQVSTEYFKALVEVVFDCYDKFKCVVDPRWYFTCENFESKGKSIEDALEELGFPGTWVSDAVPEADGWRVLRSQQPACLINDVFRRYTGRTISDPDQATGAPE
jgi:hypothetical protein